MAEQISEIYYYIEGLDETVLKINSFIKDLDFEFQKFNLKDFENKFIRFFTLEDDYEKYGKEGTNFSGKMNYTTTAFKYGLENFYLINKFELESREYIVLLRDYNKNSDLLFTSLYELMDEEEIEDMNEEEKEGLKGYNESKNSLENFVNKLRLFKEGHLRLISAFKITGDNTFIGSLNPFLLRFDIAKSYPFYKGYSLLDEEIKEIGEHIQDDLDMPPYLDIAFKSFIQSYNIDDLKIKFLLLITSLESIYTVNTIGIKKTLMKHVGKTISKNKKEYDDISTEIKCLYKKRSDISHGKEIAIENDDLITLETIVRRVIKKVKWYYLPEVKEPTKEALHNYLKTKPFQS